MNESPSGQSVDASILPVRMKPATALKQLVPYYGTSVTVKQMLADKLRDGEIQAYAWAIWESRWSKLEVAWEKGPPPGTPVKVPIDPDIFRQSLSWHTDVLQGDWVTGNLFCGGQSKGQRTMLKKVRFVADDIWRLRKEALAGRGGRTPSGARDQIWLAIINIWASEGGREILLGSKGVATRKLNEVLGWNWTGKGDKPPLSAKTAENMLAKVRSMF